MRLARYSSMISRLYFVLIIVLFLPCKDIRVVSSCKRLFQLFKLVSRESRAESSLFPSVFRCGFSSVQNRRFSHRTRVKTCWAVWEGLCEWCFHWLWRFNMQMTWRARLETRWSAGYFQRVYFSYFHLLIEIIPRRRRINWRWVWHSQICRCR